MDSDQRESSVFVDRLNETSMSSNEMSNHQSVTMLCAGLLRRGMMCELERMLRVCDGFFCSMSTTYDGAVLLW